MKKLLRFSVLSTAIFILFSIFFFSACKKENSAPSSITDQVNDIQVALKTGDPFSKEGETDGGQKGEYDDDLIETSNTDDALWDIIIRHGQGAMGNAVMGLLDDYVGVLANDLPCNIYGYAKLSVYMDDEDGYAWGTNNNSSISGWQGKSGKKLVDPYTTQDFNNIGFEFCIVPHIYFTRLQTEDFAVLRLGVDYPLGLTPVQIFQDNEDANNFNFAKDDNGYVHQYTGADYYPNPSGPLFFGGNTLLSFLYYPRDPLSSVTQLPILPNFGGVRDYGVFGTLTGHQHGTFLIDDEDGKNANYNTINFFDDNTLTYLGEVTHKSDAPWGLSGIFYQGKNTYYYLSQAY